MSSPKTERVPLGNGATPPPAAAANNTDTTDTMSVFDVPQGAVVPPRLEVELDDEIPF
jgi:hypothetical protein